ncbi:MAG: hypothetical protein QOD84_2796, partial [Acidobacteriaceae bacterium]
RAPQGGHARMALIQKRSKTFRDYFSPRERNTFIDRAESLPIRHDGATINCSWEHSIRRLDRSRFKKSENHRLPPFRPPRKMASRRIAPAHDVIARAFILHPEGTGHLGQRGRWIIRLCQ